MISTKTEETYKKSSWEVDCKICAANAPNGD